MPFKSDVQRRKFGALLKEGKITQKTFDEWNKHTSDNLPERVMDKGKQTKSTSFFPDLRKQQG